MKKMISNFENDSNVISEFFNYYFANKKVENYGIVSPNSESGYFLIWVVIEE